LAALRPAVRREARDAARAVEQLAAELRLEVKRACPPQSRRYAPAMTSYAESLPEPLRPLCEAIDLLCAVPWYERGWTPIGHPAAPAHPLREGSPFHESMHRVSWTSPGMCVRLDLTNVAVLASLDAALRARFPEQVGADDAFYEYGVDDRSQFRNRNAALAQLAAKVTATLTAVGPPS
jgi:hypothetical protein